MYLTYIHIYIEFIHTVYNIQCTIYIVCIYIDIYIYISRVLFIAPTKFELSEISLQGMRNFAKMTMKFRLTQGKFAGALAKFRGKLSLPTFARTNLMKFGESHF